MKINQISQKYGISRKAILYYEQQGLIQATRLENNYRDFNQQELDKLLEINKLRLLGVPVKVIALYLVENNGSILQDYVCGQKKMFNRDQLNIEMLEGYINSNQFPTNINIINYFKTNIPYPLGSFLASHFEYFLEKDNVKYIGNEQIFAQIINYVDSQQWDRLEQFFNKKKYTPLGDIQLKFNENFYNQISSMKEPPQIDPELPKQVEVEARKLKDELKKVEFDTVLEPLIRQLSPSYNLMYEKLEIMKEKRRSE